VESGEVHKDDPADPMRTAMRQMAGVFFQLDRAMIVKRLKDARRHKADRWPRPWGSAVRVEGGGQGTRGGPAEQAALFRIRALHSDGKSLRAIALESEGHRPHRGGRWHPNTVARTWPDWRTSERAETL
jgi:DNA invertase Pin-like site-specific DNA recombinase